MHIRITDELISQFLSGALVVLVLVAMGGILLAVLSGLKKTFPFTRMGITLALTPLSLIHFLRYGEDSFLYLYAMVAALLGITIDGINHLLTPGERVPAEKAAAESAPARKAEPAAETPRPGVIVWEKAE